jgi:peroxiredoxin
MTVYRKKSKSRAPLFLTLIAIGVMLLGAAAIPLLINGQETALDQSDIIRQPLVINQSAPQLSLTDLQGNTVSLDDYHGRIVLVNNWATWCPPCKAEMPELQAYYRAHSNQDFVIIAIESGEPAATVSSFTTQLGMTFPVWLDLKGAAVDAFKNWSLPSSYIIDKSGTMRMGWTGAVNQATLDKYVTPLLGQ